MPELGKKYTCYSCHTKFYDLGKPVPLCPKCGADQRDAEDSPAPTTSRSRAPRPVVVVEEPPEEEFGGEAEAPAAPVETDEDEEVVPEADREEEAAEEDDEDEEY